MASAAPSAAASTTRLYSSDVGTAADALAANMTLTSNDTTSSKTSVVDWNNNTTALGAPATVSLKKNDQGGLTLTVNGVEQVFTSADLSSDNYGYQINDSKNSKFVSLWAWDGNSMADQINGTNSYGKYSHVWEYFTNQLGDPKQETSGFAVLGTETKPAELAGMPTATYSGYSRSKMRQATGYMSEAANASVMGSAVSMTADFGAGTVSGALTNIRTRPKSSSTWTTVPGSISMDAASISGNGFAGTLTPDPTFKNTIGNPSISNGTYAGTFFGPAAEEVGGTLSAEGSGSGGAFNLNGFYQAKKN